MSLRTEDINNGLEGVVVATTAISNVQGTSGDLSYRGQSINHWVEQDFASVAAAVLDWPNLEFDQNLAELLFQWGQLTPRESEMVLNHRDHHPMAVLQGIVPLFAELPQRGSQRQTEALSGVAIAARLPHVVATMIAREPVHYPSEQDYAVRFLRMLGHKKPTDLQRRALSVTQILQLEHSLNAGTFAARVTASTQASLAAAISSALGALSGVLHGGADQAAMEMADQVGSADAAEAFVHGALENGKKIMGMGHREYKVVDPRAVHVKRLAKELVRGTPHETTYQTLEAVEAVFAEVMAERGKPLHANLEFYKGCVYRGLGIPDRAFTAVFAMARVFGYVAHVLESRANARIIRPAAHYHGS